VTIARCATRARKAKRRVVLIQPTAKYAGMVDATVCRGRASRLSKGAALVALFVSAAPITELATIRSQNGHIAVVIGVPNPSFEGSSSMDIVEIRRNGDGIVAEMNQMRGWLDARRIEPRLFHLNTVVVRVGFDRGGEATAFANAFDGRVLSETDARAALVHLLAGR
jgi:hypothetical protein